MTWLRYLLSIVRQYAAAAFTSASQGLQEREVLALAVVMGHLPQGRQEGGHLVPHPPLLTRLCQQVDTSGVNRGTVRGQREGNNSGY